VTAVLAGAVGGLLALAGGFLVQALGDRERRKARARSLVAAYLADLQRVLVENARRMHPDGNGDLLDALTALDVAFRSGGELALLAPPKLREEINTATDAVRSFVFADRKDMAKHDKTRLATVQRVADLKAALQTEFGTTDRAWWRRWI